MSVPGAHPDHGHRGPRGHVEVGLGLDVDDLVDPKSLGRIQVKLPWLGGDGQDVRAWATLITPYADDQQGIEILPAVDVTDGCRFSRDPESAVGLDRASKAR